MSCCASAWPSSGRLARGEGLARSAAREGPALRVPAARTRRPRPAAPPAPGRPPAFPRSASRGPGTFARPGPGTATGLPRLSEQRAGRCGEGGGSGPGLPAPGGRLPRRGRETLQRPQRPPGGPRGLVRVRARAVPPTRVFKARPHPASVQVPLPAWGVGMAARVVIECECA